MKRKEISVQIQYRYVADRNLVMASTGNRFLDSQEGAQNSRAEKPETRANKQRRLGERRENERDCALSCNRRVQGNSAHKSLNALKIQLTHYSPTVSRNSTN